MTPVFFYFTKTPFDSLRPKSLHRLLHAAFTRLHGQKGLFKKLVQFPAQRLGPAHYYVPGASSGKLLILELLFDAGDFHVHHAFWKGRISAAAPISPVSSSAAKSTFSIGWLRPNVAADAIPVRADRADHILVHAALPQQLRRLKAMLPRVKLKIDIVQKPHDGPGIRLAAIAQLARIPAPSRPPPSAHAGGERARGCIFSKEQALLLW